jgi:hypothetical protein
VKPTIPDFDWYSATSSRLGLSPRCPFANTHACPRYYQSLSLLGLVGHTPIEEKEDEQLLEKWKSSPLWPSTAEQTPSVSGPSDKLESFSHFCPEVAYDRFGYFAMHLGRYPDEIDQDLAHQRLGKAGVSGDDPRWAWGTHVAQHYSECPVYSPLKHGWPKEVRRTSAKTTSGGATDVRFDVFISHASEDKDEFVRPLAAELTRLGLSVWYDESTLTLGDSLRGKIDEGLSRSTFGAVVLSHSFFAKAWPQAELDGLFAKEMDGNKVILPIWHHLTKEDVVKYSPLLAGKLSAPSDQGVEAVARDIYSVVRPNSAPPLTEPSPPVLGNRAETKAKPLTELLRTMDDIAPLLHKLDQNIAELEAQVFFQAMQRFFYGSNILTEVIDDNLRFGLDNLLRVIASDGLHPNYLSGKLTAARACFEDFRVRNKIGHMLPEIDRSSVVEAEMRFLHGSALSMVEDVEKMREPDIFSLRLTVALLQYGASQRNQAHRFPTIPPNVHGALRALLVFTFGRQLNAHFPDTLDDVYCGDMRGLLPFSVGRSNSGRTRVLGFNLRR